MLGICASREVASLEGRGCPAASGERGQCLGDKFHWSAEWFWRAALQGTAPSVCTGGSPVPQCRPASWGQPMAGVTQHPVHPPPAPRCSPPLSVMACWRACSCEPRNSLLRCWFPSLRGMCFLGAVPIPRQLKRVAEEGEGCHAPRTPQRPSLPAAEHRLRFQVQLADVEVAEREDAVLECQVPLETIPTTWYLEDRELQPSHKYLMEERGVVRRLTIRDARTDDDGIYLCQMKDKGRSIAEVSVRGEGHVSSSTALPSCPPTCHAPHHPHHLPSHCLAGSCCCPSLTSSSSSLPLWGAQPTPQHPFPALTHLFS